MPELRADSTWRASRPTSSGGDVTEAKTDPEWQAEQNKRDLERFLQARRRRGVVDPPGRDDRRAIRYLHND